MPPSPDQIEQPTLAEILRLNSKDFHRNAAIVQPGLVAWDYDQLAHHLSKLGVLLRSLHLTPHDTVAVAMPDGAACLLTQLAVLHFCACAPLNPQLTPAELKRDLEELGARAFICSPGYTEGLQIAEELGLVALQTSLEQGELVWHTPYFVADRTSATAKPNNGAALLLHTSATTGRRKIVPLTRANLAAASTNTRQSLRLTPQDRLLVMARLFHAQGVLSVLSQLSAGGTVIVTDTLDPAVLTRLFISHKPTWYTCGPTLNQAILAQLQKHPLAEPQSLRLVRSGGNTLPPALNRALEQQLGVPVLDMYGLSETGAVAAASLDPAWPAGWRSVGPEISIMSSQGKPLPAGEEGEIVVRGPSVLTGYWNDDAANREAFWPSPEGPWFRTGDLGVLDFEGTLTMSGRLKEMINRGGQKIVPTEVDQVLRAHPAVKAVATFAMAHPTLGEDVACAVVLHEGLSVTEAGLQSFARQTLARYKVPRRIHFLDALPLGATGKPQRLVLRERFGGRQAASPGADAWAGAYSFTRTEKVIAELWAAQLLCSEIRPQDDYFQLGGDSLRALSMLSEVEALLERPLPTGATERFFESPTLQTLANLLAAPSLTQEIRSHDLRLYPLLGAGPGLEAFLMPADDEEGWYFRLLSRHLGKQRPLWLVRPENGLYAPGPGLIERAASNAVALIRKHRPDGPYLLGGFCLGGVIAYEAARLIEQQGESVTLVLFDSPMPGEPHVVRGWRRYWNQFRVLTRSATPRRILAFPVLCLRRLLWLALRKVTEHSNTDFQWLRRHAEHDYFPLYRPRPSRVPILHFVMAEGQEPLRALSVQSWRQITAGETKVMPLAGSHHSLFRESNLLPISDAIQEWSAHALGAGK